MGSGLFIESAQTLNISTASKMTARADRLWAYAGGALFVGFALGILAGASVTRDVYRVIGNSRDAAHALQVASLEAQVAAGEEARVYAVDSWAIRGLCSWYDESSSGPITASGARFDETELTAAHKGMPFGSRWTIRNLRNGKSVVVTCVDRGPYMGNRTWDLSRAAFAMIEDLDRGVIEIIATPIFAGGER